MGKMSTTNNCKGLMNMVLKLIAGVFPSAVLLTIEKTKTKDPKVLSVGTI